MSDDMLLRPGGMSERPDSLDRWIDEGMLTEGQYDTIWNAKSGALDNPDLDDLLAYVVPQVAINTITQIEQAFRNAAAATTGVTHLANLEAAEQMAQTRISIEIDMERYDL